MGAKSKPDRPWTAEERRHVADLMGQGYGPADIAACMPGRTRVEVNGLVYRLRHQDSPEPRERVQHVGWPVINPDKEWPIGCFEGQDISQATLDSELTRIRTRPPMRVERFGVPVYG